MYPVSTKQATITLFVVALLASGCPASTPEVDSLEEQDDVTPELQSELETGGPPVCPPPEPFGVNTGARMADLAFTLLTGDQVSTHGLCGEPLTLIYSYYGW